MLKTLFCLSTFLTLGTTANANIEYNLALNENICEEIVVEDVIASQDSQSVADDVLNEITEKLAGCPNCPRKPKTGTNSAA